MTRINVIPVEELTDKHLVAEYKEILRLPKNLNKSLNRKSKPFSSAEIPASYTMGKGHVKFFYDKFRWLDRRFKQLCGEMKARGYVTNFEGFKGFSEVPSKYYGDYMPDQKAININLERIKERLS